MQVYMNYEFSKHRYQEKKVRAEKSNYMSIPKNNIGDTVSFGSTQSEMANSLEEIAKSVSENKKIISEAKKLILESIEVLKETGQDMLQKRNNYYSFDIKLKPFHNNNSTGIELMIADDYWQQPYFLMLYKNGDLAASKKGPAYIGTLSNSDEIKEWNNDVIKYLKLALPSKIKPIEDFMSESISILTHSSVPTDHLNGLKSLGQWEFTIKQIAERDEGGTLLDRPYVLEVRKKPEELAVKKEKKAKKAGKAPKITFFEGFYGLNKIVLKDGNNHVKTFQKGKEYKGIEDTMYDAGEEPLIRELIKDLKSYPKSFKDLATEMF